MGRDQISKFKTFLVLLGGLGTLAGGVISTGAAVVKVKSAERVTLPPRSTETTR